MAKGTPEQVKEQNRRRWDRARQYIREKKQAGHCIDCKETYHFAAMQYDHLPGTEKFKMVSDMYCYSLKRIDEEISKCELICANCHAIRSYERQIEEGIFPIPLTEIFLPNIFP